MICEDIERSGRDTFNALKLEKQLAEAGIPLFATDEPIDIGGMNATTLLVRRVEQGIAEWYRFQIKEKAWKGLREHSLAGWNIGPAPYGYLAEKVAHPVAVKAAQGRTKSRLIIDPQRARPGQARAVRAPKHPCQALTWVRVGQPDRRRSVPRGPKPAPAGRSGSQSNTTALDSSPISTSAPGCAPASASASSMPSLASRSAR